MKLLVPYVPSKLRPETIEALQADGLEPDYRLCEGDQGYWQVLASVWGHCRDDLVIVEHDIVVNPGSVSELVECPEHWCVFPYEYLDDHYGVGLGCVKFSRWLQARADNLMQRVGDASRDRMHPQKHWCRLDILIAGEVRAWHLSRHIHQPPVGHISDGRPSHGCI